MLIRFRRFSEIYLQKLTYEFSVISKRENGLNLLFYASHDISGTRKKVS